MENFDKEKSKKEKHRLTAQRQRLHNKIYVELLEKRVALLESSQSKNVKDLDKGGNMQEKMQKLLRDRKYLFDQLKEVIG